MTGWMRNRHKQGIPGETSCSTACDTWWRFPALLPPPTTFWRLLPHTSIHMYRPLVSTALKSNIFNTTRTFTSTAIKMGVTVGTWGAVFVVDTSLFVL